MVALISFEMFLFSVEFCIGLEIGSTSVLTLTSGWKKRIVPTKTPKTICPNNLNFPFNPFLFFFDNFYVIV